MLHCVQTTHSTIKCFTFKSSIVFNIVEHVLEIIVVWLQFFIWRSLVYQMRPVVNQFFFVSCDVYLVQNQTVMVVNGTKCREIIHLLTDLMSCLMSCYQVYFELICLKRQFNNTSDCVSILWGNVFTNHIFIQIVVRLCKFLDIFIFALVAFFAKTSPYNIMDLRNNTPSWCQETFVVETGALLCVKLVSKTFEMIQIIFFLGSQHLKMIIWFMHKKRILIFTVYCINSGLSDAPCNNFQFFLFLVRSVWYKSKQCQMFFNKQICGGIFFCKPPYCSIWHLEAREYFGLCGNKDFSETMMWVNFFWTAPSLMIGELLLVVKDRALHATMEFWGLWLHIRKDAPVCDASAGVSLEEIQQRVFE